MVRLIASITRLRLALWRALHPARHRWMPLRVWTWLQPKRLSPISAVTGYITPGLSKVFWVTTLTSTTSPSAAQVNAGTELTPAVKGIPDAPRSGNRADDSDLSSRIDVTVRGTITLGAITLQLKRTTATETEYNALSEGDSGYLVVFRKGTAGASPASGDVADVYTVDVDVKAPGTPGRNETDFSNIELARTAEDSYDATLAA